MFCDIVLKTSIIIILIIYLNIRDVPWYWIFEAINVKHDVMDVTIILQWLLLWSQPIRCGSSQYHEWHNGPTDALWFICGLVEHIGVAICVNKNEASGNSRDRHGSQRPAFYASAYGCRCIYIHKDTSVSSKSRDSYQKEATILFLLGECCARFLPTVWENQCQDFYKVLVV